MSEQTDTTVSDLDIEQFIDGPDQPSYHTLLEVFRSVLEPSADEARKKVTPQWAARMLSSYPGLTFADMNELRDRYFGLIGDLLQILEVEISTDPTCLKHLTPEEDAEHNSVHYKNLLLLWQMAITQAELDWDTTDEYAGAELAAISEVHKMFFGQVGLTQYLDNIPFEFTEADQQQLADALNEQRGTSE